jgi:DNA-binding beta-propeller fold protein YncE
VIARAPAGAVLLVANRLESTLTFVDVATGRELGTTDTGYHPHDIAMTPDGRTAFVAHYGAGESVSVIDVAARRELRQIDLGLGRGPLGLQVRRDGTKLYVTPEATQAVLEIDLATEKVVRILETGQEVSRLFVVAPDGRRLYTANFRNGTVTVLDLNGLARFRDGQ